MRWIAATTLLFVLSSTPVWAVSDLRAWSAHGQTWIVWQDDPPYPFTYEVYRSDAPIADLSSATLIGRLLEEDITTPRLKLAEPDATWAIPDGSGGRYTLAADEGLFVETPHNAAAVHYAVVREGETAVGPGNSIGPVTPNLDSVICHYQFSGVTEADRHYAIYAHWVDGREDPDDGRPDYPVMANAYANGVGHVFALYEPDDGRTGNPLPMVIGLHGGGDSNYFRFASGYSDIWQIEMGLPQAFLLAIDDALHVRETTLFGGPFTFAEHTRWLGYWTGFNRFEVPTVLPPDDAVVVDYTVRRFDFILNWMLDNEPEIDPQAISLFGVSGGGAAVSFYTRIWPDRFSAGHNFVGPLQGTPAPFAQFMQGLINQNLVTTLPGEPGLRDFYWPTYGIEGDLPFQRVIAGKYDYGDPWDVRVESFEDIDAHHLGWAMYWDEREHIFNWPGQYWIGSEKHNLDALTRYRADRSFPAFSNDDQDPDLEGRQPDPGDDRDNGEPAGTWNGYFDWDTDTIVDEADRWEATVFLTSESSSAADIPSFDTLQADVTIRRPQAFFPSPGTTLEWRMEASEDEKAEQSGTTTAQADGRVTIDGIAISKTPERLIVKTADAPDDDTDDDDVDDDDADDDVEDDDTDGPPGGGDDDDDQNSDDDDDDDSGCGC